MTEADLGAHQGLVRCGRCREVFNASWNIVGALPDESISYAQLETTDEIVISDGIIELPAVPVDADHGGEDDAGQKNGLSDPEQAIEPDQLDAETEPEPEPEPESESESEVEPEVEPEPEVEVGLDNTFYLDDLDFDIGGDDSEDVEPKPGDEERNLAELTQEPTVDASDDDDAHIERNTKTAENTGPEWLPEDTDDLQPLPHVLTGGPGEETVEEDEADRIVAAELEVNLVAEDESHDPDTELEVFIPGEIAEEIIIEAPSHLWNFADELDAPGAVPGEEAAAADEASSPSGTPATQEKGAVAYAEDSVAPEPRKITPSHKSSDVKLVEIPHPKPAKVAAWMAATLFLLLASFWQLKTYYLSDLAEVTALRSSLETMCEYVSCSVPPRTNIKLIDLTSTSVNPHPVTPGALRVSVNLINRAKFAQRFPPLEVTLTDKGGDIVGRRTYLPHEYRSDPPGDMPPNVILRADLDLAQPAQSAVGYEIQLVAR